MKPFIGLISTLAAVLSVGAAPSSAQQTKSTAPSPGTVELYTLDCGLTEFADASYFSDTGEYDGKALALPTPCYLIRHGSDWLLWDTGNGDSLASQPGGKTKFGGRFTVKQTLAGQLAMLGLKPDDIRYVAISHLHQDHTGNIGLFPKATFLISSAELSWARTKPTPFGVDAPAIAPLARAKVDASDDDRDVFKDGTVRILKAPGHTPGSRMLLVKLPKTGNVLISGDLFHTRQNYEKQLVPAVNLSRADTVASEQRFNRLATNLRARVVIQHAPEDFAAMPAFPKFLD
ncbi:N-acyl homoserine lactonase family protein [Sphingobium subterraneum]|uniref:Glyoxylase-like metal-dependent hydrolase (Beta-lactamase superfamily II) n=1 Tax=Sphingobium subterraneum TaxID=627688 RepID=A0A841IVT7_9SPHN|nr:N-acyl homoserine lactonase family protein [Sphingobium subterraneum]MBB6122783.1 glyoxylase-like metal-dependent hydrolase (beta-lactamase superfamily II) [Sphingobium subterraneum]